MEGLRSVSTVEHAQHTLRHKLSTRNVNAQNVFLLAFWSCELRFGPQQVVYCYSRNATPPSVCGETTNRKQHFSSIRAVNRESKMKISLVLQRDARKPVQGPSFSPRGHVALTCRPSLKALQGRCSPAARSDAAIRAAPGENMAVFSCVLITAGYMAVATGVQGAKD